MTVSINKNYPCNTDNYAKITGRPIQYIVIHYVGASGSALENAKYFNSHSGLEASAHFFVGHASENGAIYQSVDPKNRAWHCGTTGTYKHAYCRNANSIGIELCCHRDSAGSWYFDDATVNAAIELTSYLMDVYSIPIGNVIRHYDVTGKNCPAPFVINQAAWNDFKNRLEESEVANGTETGDNPSNWAKEHTEWAKGKGIFNGDGQGNYDWQGALTRESLAVVLHKFATVYGLEVK